MNQSLLKYIILPFSLTLIFSINNAQEYSNSGINLGVKIGGSKLLGEITKDFSEVINEFDNKIGFASAIEISKYISKRWETGSEIGYSTLNGNTYSPEFSVEGIQPGLPDEINDPVEYKNRLLGFNFFFRYYFKAAGSKSAFIPFIRAGGGVLNYNSKFKYIDAPDDDLLFGKGTKGLTKLSTPVFFIGTGIKSQLSSNFYLVTSIDFNMVNYDFLDVVHNYDNEENRMQLTGLFTEFKIGIFYNLNKTGKYQNKKKNGKKGSSSGTNNLPFAR